MDKRPGLIPELIIPIGAVAFGSYYISTVASLPFQARIVGIYVTGAICILSLALFIRFARELRSGEKSFSFAGFLSDPASEGRRWSVLLLTILFIALMPVLGFIVSLFLFVLGTVLIIGGMERLKVALLISTIMTVTAFTIFILFVRVRFPLSIVDQTIRNWVF
ncbi:tripartite tricarboxylate transporter TctB family protein [uncultured Jannaschia sp.]|uniref:tripartite tricarboxylate transporter TctB family protein n=1 Tax=uncultured Jannaschia sp. TaxID=293347 RepID=UPI00262A2335|nr:tripartite tricarboxylate transporter TctB family protein [uncultured Jannaschia sp.]